MTSDIFHIAPPDLYFSADFYYDIIIAEILSPVNRLSANLKLINKFAEMSAHIEIAN